LASSAIGNLDLEFQLDQDINNFDFSPKEIKELRKRYAQELFDNKMFVFGKYVTAGDGTVRTLLLSHRFHRSLGLSTF